MNGIFDIAMEETEDDYEPYGKEWEKEMMKMTKKELVDFIRRIKTKPEA